MLIIDFLISLFRKILLPDFLLHETFTIKFYVLPLPLLPRQSIRLIFNANSLSIFDAHQGKSPRFPYAQIDGENLMHRWSEVEVVAVVVVVVDDEKSELSTVICRPRKD